MVRKPTVVAGTIDWVTGFGTDAANSEWIVNPENDFTNLGMHNSTGNIPAITVTNPLDGSTVYLTDVTVEFTVANFAVGTTSAGLDGHVHYSFDGGSTVMIYDTNPIPFTGLALGSHTMKMWLVDNAHQPLSPAVEDSIGFTIALNNQALITSFVVPNMIGNEIIDNMNFTVLAVVPPSTNLTSIIPTIGVSTAATINPASGVAQDFTNVVSYTVTAQDGTTQLWSVSVIQPSLLTISAIQGQSAASPYAGQTVITGGIVTGVFSGLNGYFVQDGAGAWNGVFVYDSQNTPAVGDDVSFMAEVEEYYELTELKNISGFVVNSSGNALPAVTLLSTNDVNNEDYEGVLVRVEAAECIDLPNSYDEWTVNDGSGACMVDNDNFAYAPTIGSFYNIQGPLNFTFGDFKIQIRESADISVYASTNMISNNNVSVYPNPVNDVLNISNLESNSTVAIFNVLGTMISTHSANNSLSIDMSSLSSGVYFVRVENSETITSTRIVKR